MCVESQREICDTDGSNDCVCDVYVMQPFVNGGLSGMTATCVIQPLGRVYIPPTAPIRMR